MAATPLDDEDTTAQALLQWVSLRRVPPLYAPGPHPSPPSSPHPKTQVNSFETTASAPITALDQLSDGLVLADVLHDIDPQRFPHDLVTRPSSASASLTPTSNWALGLTNLKKLVRHLEAYYQEDLGLHLGHSRDSSYFATLDLAGIAREKRGHEVVKLLELVVLAAVRAPAPDKARAYVEKIMLLSPEAQAVLKDSVEATLQRTTPTSSSSSFISSPSSAASDMAELRAALAQEREGKARLHQTVSDLQGQLASLTETAQDAQHRASRQQEEEVEGQRKSLEAALARAEELRVAYNSLTVKLEEQEGESEHWRVEAERLHEKHRAEKEKAEQAEDAQRRLADEVDVLREKARALQDMEGTLEKYKARLEVAAEAKQHCKDLEGQNARYLDQIMALEEKAKSTVPALRKVVEQYKEKVVELERERYQAVEARQLKEAEVGRLKEEVDAGLEAKRFLMEECQELKRALQAAQQQHSPPPPQRGDEGRGGMAAGGGGGGGFSLFEDPLKVKEKLGRLERENKTLRKKLEGGEGWPAIGGEEDVLLLRSQLQDLAKVKAERDEESIKAKKRAIELENDLQMLRAQHEELEEELACLRKEEVLAKAAHDKAVARLRGQAKEQEAEVERLRVEKGKMEVFTRNKLLEVQEKYTQTLDSVKVKYAELKKRNAALEERLEQDRAAQKREERLLMGVVYGIGMDMLVADEQGKVGGVVKR